MSSRGFGDAEKAGCVLWLADGHELAATQR